MRDPHDQSTDIEGATFAFKVPVVLTSDVLARCRQCGRNDVPLTEMAVASFKPMFGMFTGICLECFKEDV